MHSSKEEIELAHEKVEEIVKKQAEPIKGLQGIKENYLQDNKTGIIDKDMLHLRKEFIKDTLKNSIKLKIKLKKQLGLISSQITITEEEILERLNKFIHKNNK